ncbi:MAG: putative DNA binding domain-containing protein [Candidatus Saganbacteria bacterium]|nr:putative DNA binding domain-containing protein [Candidatus Saganbacteria bacterium]
MNWEDVVTLLDQGEGQSVEFEKQIPTADDIAREMVAFANSDGGRIIYGLDDKNKHLLGVEIDSNFKDFVEDIAKKRCQPHLIPDIEIIDKNEKKIVVIHVPEGDEKPYKTDEICYIRDGAISRPARDEEENEIKSPWAGKNLNKRQKRALQLISEHGSITNREYREAFGVSHKTAHIEMTLLADKKIVLTQGSGRSTCYILPPSP